MVAWFKIFNEIFSSIKGERGREREREGEGGREREREGDGDGV